MEVGDFYTCPKCGILVCTTDSSQVPHVCKESSLFREWWNRVNVYPAVSKPSDYEELILRTLLTVINKIEALEKKIDNQFADE